MPGCKGASESVKPLTLFSFCLSNTLPAMSDTSASVIDEVDSMVMDVVVGLGEMLTTFSVFKFSF